MHQVVCQEEMISLVLLSICRYNADIPYRRFSKASIFFLSFMDTHAVARISHCLMVHRSGFVARSTIAEGSLYI